MSDINWKNGGVCYAGGEFWLLTNKVTGCLANKYGTCVEVQYLLECPDFQLNEIKEGDFIPASELDTEQKYNEAVEVFGLFGFSRFNGYSYKDAKRDFDSGAKRLFLSGTKSIMTTPDNGARQLTYSQIIAIGKLKRMMLDREKPRAVSSADLTEDNADQVKNPQHYQLIEGIESIEIIARSMTKEQWKGFCLGNMLEYRIRAGKKDALKQDIGKADFYGDLYEMHKDKCYD